MKRKEYMKPTVNTVKVKATQMLCTSGVESKRSGYGDAQESTWDDDE